MTRWRKFGDVAFLQLLSANGGVEVDGRDLAHEAIALLRSGLDGDVRDRDTVGWNLMLMGHCGLKTNVL